MKIVKGEHTVTLVGKRDLTLEFNSEEEKEEFYECFPLLGENIARE